MSARPDQGTRVQGLVYRDFCNTCGAARDGQHAERCHLTGVVGTWSGIVSAARDQQRLPSEEDQ